jgi:transforming growth factor-beta-induced protein
MKNSFKLLAAGAAAAALMVAPSAVSAQDEEPSIAEIAVGADDFDTLVAAADAAGLVGLLSDCSAGPFTVFAPTDAAFGALPQDVLDAALADPDGLLTTVLTYHVVPGTVLAADVVGLSSATTVQGEDISVNGTVLNGSVNIVTTDLVACNGVVHVIDAVLLPPSLTADAPAADAPSEELPATGVNNLTAGLAAAALLAGGLALIGVSRRRITV